MERNELWKWGATFRIEKDLLHKEMAEGLGVSASYLSSLEHGRKPIPDDWVERVKGAFDLSLPEAASLRVAIIRSKREAKVAVSNIHEARVMVAFESTPEPLSEEKAKQIEQIMLQ